MYNNENQENKGRGLMVNISYPQNDYYRFEAYLERIDLDAECEKDIQNNNGFIISDKTDTFDKELRDIDGMFSSRFGQTLADTNPYMHRHKCRCGHLQMKFYNGIICPKCKTPVKFIDDNYEYFGWKKLKHHYIIHPNLFEAIQSLIGADRLDKILYYVDEKDEDGHSIDIDPETGKRVKNFKFRKKVLKTQDTYDGIGITAFMEYYDEIIEYYYKKKPEKIEIYNDLLKHRNITFTQSIPVFTTYLRPYDIDGKDFPYESTNGMYKMIIKHACLLNKDELSIDRKIKPNEQSLYKLQINVNRLYGEIINIVSGKKGNFRQLFGGRYAHSARCVIVQNPQLEIDQVTLPYFCLVELLQHQITNILMKSNNISHSDATIIIDEAMRHPVDMVIKIINSIISSNPNGLPVVINRNPTIARGGVLQVFCIGMTLTYTMGISLQVLEILAADFDGDVLNIFMIINKAFRQRAEEQLNPRNCMYISNNDGRTNISVIPQRDTIINANAMIRLSRKNYTEEQLNQIYKLKNNRFDD